MSEDLMLYTLHRFAVYAAGKGIPFDKSALTKTLSLSGIKSFSALIDLDEHERDRLGVLVLKNLDVASANARLVRFPNSRLRQSER